MNEKRDAFFSVFFIAAVLVSALLLLWTAGFGQAAQDSVFTVNSIDDIDDGSCDGTHCSLREAIQAANDGGGTDTIVFSLAPQSTIVLAGSQLPAITDALTIDGNTALDLTISADDGSRVFKVRGDTEFTITTLNIRDGSSAYGGGIYNEGGIVNVHNSHFFGHDVLSGGGIANWEGTLNVSDSSFSSNVSAISGGAIFSYGGTANISRSLFHYNWNTGGGIGGGAIANEGGVLNINNSTFTDNTCFKYRGSCYGGGVVNTGQLNLRNSTFTGNLAMSYPAPQGGGVSNHSSGVMNFSNTIISDNYGGDCVSGSIIGNVNNLVRDGSCNPAISSNPLLGPLQDNGGPTWTRALKSISPAVDSGDEATCAAPPVNNLDQRGMMRPLDGDGDGMARCDIGAYEYDGPPPKRFYLPLFFGR